MNSRDKTTQEIIAVKYRSKTEEKFDAIYKAYADDIYRVCLCYVKDKDAAQELTIQTFLEFYDYFEDVTQELVRAYLVHTARRLADNHLSNSNKKDEEGMRHER